jgi:hypothetical protein
MHIAEAQTSKQYNGKQILCYIKEHAHRDIILKNQTDTLKKTPPV